MYVTVDTQGKQLGYIFCVNEVINIIKTHCHLLSPCTAKQKIKSINLIGLHKTCMLLALIISRKQNGDTRKINNLLKTMQLEKAKNSMTRS